MNLKDYFTQDEAIAITGYSRAQLVPFRAKKLGNTYIYNRADIKRIATEKATTDAELHLVSIIDTVFPAIDKDISGYITRTEALRFWEHSHEWLYQQTVRAVDPAIRFVKFGRIILFCKEDILAWAN